jgi:hypothetical protein
LAPRSLLFFAGLLGSFVQGCGNAPGALEPISPCATSLVRWPATELVRSTSGAELEVEASLWNVVEGDPDGDLMFRLSFTTHTGDASIFDPAGLATVESSDGARVTDGFGWRSISEDSHHRSGRLTLGHQLPGGGHLVGCETSELRLILTDVGVPVRTFAWRDPYLGPLRRP